MKLNLGPKAIWRIAIVLAVLGGITLLVGVAVALLWAVNKIVS
jgi:flagellar biosynthesis protein FliQ